MARILTFRLFFLVALCEAAFILVGHHKNLSSHFLIGCFAIICASLLDMIAEHTQEHREEIKIFSFILVTIYSWHAAWLGYAYYAIPHKQWINSVEITPIYKEPFKYPVGFNMKTDFKEPLPVQLRPISISLITSESPKSGSYEVYRMSNTEGRLDNISSIDLYTTQYLDLNDGSHCVSNYSIGGMLNDNIKYNISIYKDLDSGLGDKIIVNELEEYFSQNPSLAETFSNIAAIYKQFKPENMTKAGFKICESTKWLDCYCSSTPEKENENQQKPN